MCSPLFLASALILEAFFVAAANFIMNALSRGSLSVDLMASATIRSTPFVMYSCISNDPFILVPLVQSLFTQLFDQVVFHPDFFHQGQVLPNPVEVILFIYDKFLDHALGHIIIFKQ